MAQVKCNVVANVNQSAAELKQLLSAAKQELMSVSRYALSLERRVSWFEGVAGVAENACAGNVALTSMYRKRSAELSPCPTRTATVFEGWPAPVQWFFEGYWRPNAQYHRQSIGIRVRGMVVLGRVM